MDSSFNQQFLVEKLAKLNGTRASIKTLSHWCILRGNKAKQVVETWGRQFHCSPRDQRLAFLYLANDILKISKRNSEFFGEFWKVLPDALGDVIKNGDEFGRNAALRLIDIWEDRKIFGSRGQILKQELVGNQSEINNNKIARHVGFKLKQPVGSTVNKIFSGYQVIYGGPMDEDVILNKCRNAINCIQKVDKGLSGDVNSGQFHGSALVQGQHAVLRNCIEQLTAVASLRASLISHLRQALQEQELKMEQVHIQLQAAQSQSERACNICRQLMNRDNPDSSCRIEEDPRKSAAAAAMAAKLTASSSSAQMLSLSEKRPELKTDQPYIPSQNPQPAHVSPFSHTESHQHNFNTTSQQLTPNEMPPPPSSSPPPLPPVPPYMPTAGSLNVVCNITAG